MCPRWLKLLLPLVPILSLYSFTLLMSRFRLADLTFEQAALVAFLLLSLVLSSYARSSRASRKLPPGPPGFPLLGNVFQVPTKVCKMILIVGR